MDFKTLSFVTLLNILRQSTAGVMFNRYLYYEVVFLRTIFAAIFWCLLMILLPFSEPLWTNYTVRYIRFIQVKQVTQNNLTVYVFGFSGD